MAEYKIARVSAIPPREWDFTDKRTNTIVHMLTYKVMFEESEDVVDVNRKVEGGKTPEVGEVLTGTLESTEFGKRFKAERKPFTLGFSKDQSGIKAQWAIGQAVQVEIAYIKNLTEFNFTRVEQRAKKFFVMTEIVKDAKLNEEKSGFEKAQEVAHGIMQPKSSNPSPSKGLQHFSDGSPVQDEVFPVEDEPINLDDIPF